MRYFVCSDVHGFYSLMMESLKDAGYFEYKGDKKLLIVGDIMDRGSEAVEMQKFILDMMKQNKIILVRGNHEDLFDKLVHFKNCIPSYYDYHNGTVDTLIQLVQEINPNCRSVGSINEISKDIEFLKTIIPATVNYFETKNYIFTHGYLPCRKTDRGMYQIIENWRDCDEYMWGNARWINCMEASSMLIDPKPEKTIVCGHYHTSWGHSNIEKKCSEFGDDADFSPYYGDKLIAIDGCTAYSGIVNCIVIDD